MDTDNIHQVGNSKPDQPRVTVGGEAINTRRHDTGGVVFGVLLLMFGCLLLLNTLGLVSWDIWHEIVQFWPVLLVLVGFHVIVGNSELARLVMLVISVAAVGFVVWYALWRTGSSLMSAVPPGIERLFILLQHTRP